MLEELSELSCTCHAVSQVARILRDGLRSEGMRSRQLRRREMAETAETGETRHGWTIMGKRIGSHEALHGSVF